MARIQLVETARALAALGHEVDIATAELRFLARRRPIVMARGVRRVPLTRARWSDYDAVETNFHQGWETLERYGGSGHPFVIAKLGSVVGPEDMAGIYYYGRDREHMFDTQRAIHERARFVTLLSGAAQELWATTLGPREGHLLVPGAAATEIPDVGRDPFPPRDAAVRVVFSGNLYDWEPEGNRVLSEKLNTLGRILAGRARVYFVGPGRTHHLDSRVVTNLGVASYEASWQHMFHADVGIVVSAGAFMHNNESTKLYHYLRSGLPIVSESGFPNDHVVTESGFGYVVPSGDMETMAARILDAAHQPWDRAAAVRYALEHHTWQARMRTYDELLRSHFPS